MKAVRAGSGSSSARARGKLLITHKFREVSQFADDVTVLRRGRVAGRGPAQSLDAPTLAEMMMGSRPAAGEGDPGPAAVPPRRGASVLRVDAATADDQARSRGVAILLVSADLDEILTLADRILVISEGKIVHQVTGERAEVASSASTWPARNRSPMPDRGDSAW